MLSDPVAVLGVMDEELEAMITRAATNGVVIVQTSVAGIAKPSDRSVEVPALLDQYVVIDQVIDIQQRLEVRIV